MTSSRLPLSLRGVAGGVIFWEKFNLDVMKEGAIAVAPFLLEFMKFNIHNIKIHLSSLSSFVNGTGVWMKHSFCVPCPNCVQVLQVRGVASVKHAGSWREGSCGKGQRREVTARQEGINLTNGRRISARDMNGCTPVRMPRIVCR
jgi:hypothetical protein